ncbi:MAG: dTDP-4-amino-4,6-dideoxygalactose transaminase [Bacteroidales bacterium]|nr:dTDP-4-amino-4,6-dideoxygalactose transaminase [Bacteroidales bacterium]
MITFNKPFITGKEAHYLYKAVDSGHLSGNGPFTRKCHSFFEEKWGFVKTLLTTSCTDALEMCTMLLEVQEGDEIIVPSYTFVSTALAFARQGAKIVFADSSPDHPGIDVDKIEALITSKTKAIVPVHYAGIACNMDKIMDMANRHNIFVVEDAAQAIDSYYTVVADNSPIGKKGDTLPLGSIGHLGCFSFHETKNIHCGEGGLLAINDPRFIKRAEIIWEKGTNRAEFFRGEVNKYGWKDTGSSFLPSELNASFLCAQLEELADIQTKRKKRWDKYYHGLIEWANGLNVQLPIIPDYATNNSHMFYMICPDQAFRDKIIQHTRNNNIQSIFHYLSLHKSEYYKNRYEGEDLRYADKYSEQLVRLPLYIELTDDQVQTIIDCILEFQP